MNDVNGCVPKSAAITRLAPFDTQSNKVASFQDFSLSAVQDDNNEGQKGKEVKEAIYESVTELVDYVVARPREVFDRDSDFF